ncbi:MAG: hypothetical protein IRY83_03975 [Chloroflexi bacterium]|nr:hypothetical protein [Chloroflexota bacterium]
MRTEQIDWERSRQNAREWYVCLLEQIRDELRHALELGEEWTRQHLAEIEAILRQYEEDTDG